MNNISNMNMAGVNPVGGPVGGGMPMMNNGNPNQPRSISVSVPQETSMTGLLNTYIYDYFIRNDMFDCARVLLQSNANVGTQAKHKTSPGRRRDADGNLVNGIDDNSMDTDVKEEMDSKRPDDLPPPMLPTDCPNAFLHDWWSLFWDMFGAQRNKNKGGDTYAYVQHTQNQQRIRQEQQNQLLRGMNPTVMNYQSMMRGLQQQNGLMPNDLQRKAVANSRNATPQQQMQHMMNQKIQQQQLLQQQAMRRDGSDIDINGQPRAQSPSSNDNAPSPSKRPRLDGNQFNGEGMRPNGMGQNPMTGQQVGNSSNQMAARAAQNLLFENGIRPDQLNANQFNTFQQQHPHVQNKSIKVYNDNLAAHHGVAMRNNGAMPNRNSPMMPPGPDGQIPVMGNDFFQGQNAMRMQGQPPNHGNHALQDYQMQLMLLEQQNKKRLLIARQEQETMNRPDQGPGGGPGQAGFAGMSPQGSRSGPSPNPSEQMKRGTPPKMGQLPGGSPLTDGSIPQTRDSPTAVMGFNPGPMPQEMFSGLYKANPENTGILPTGMRPPSSHPGGFSQGLTQPHMEMMNRTQPARVGPNWANGQQAPAMLQQGSQGGQQPQPMGTPQRANAAMPPPQAPPGGVTGGNIKTQPSSPQQPAAPPTPQQTNKANPKGGKKEAKERKPPRKKASTTNPTAGATPSSEADPPPTPTPSTPITPMHRESFNSGPKAQGGAAQPSGNQQPASSAPAQLAATSQNSNAFPTDNFMPDDNPNFDNIHDGLGLDGFDFDSFLHQDGEPGGEFFGNDLTYSNDTVEAGAGDV